MIRALVIALALWSGFAATDAGAVTVGPERAMVPVAGAGPIPTASGARVVGDETSTRFVLDLDSAVNVGAFTLGDPYRVIVDLPEIAFALPKDAGSEGRGLVSGWRYGLFAKGRSRIVLDATGPVKIEKAFSVPPADGQPARLVVELVRTTAEDFRTDLQRTALTREASNEVPVEKSDRIAAPGQGKKARPLVLLDPGHGGVDSGTVSPGGTLEKDIVLTFAFQVKKVLEASGKVDVAMTRDDDRFIPLGDRVRIARDQAADLFVSIHADSVRQGDVRGATVYTLSDRASDKEAAALAAKENASDIIAGLDLDAANDEVSDILVELTRRETKNFSVAFANTLVTEMSATTRMIRNPHRYAGFRVLKAPDVPSVLVEIGYLSNGQDEKLLTSEEWRTRNASAIAGAIVSFFGQKYADVGSPVR